MPGGLKVVVARVWRVFAHAAALAVLCLALGYLILWSFSEKGPVIEVLSGPNPNHVLEVKQGGEISYDVTTIRHQSCPGTVVAQFSQRRYGTVWTFIVSRPVLYNEVAVGEPVDAHVVWQLPESVRHGEYTFRATVDSQCQTRKRQDVIGQFRIRILEPNKESKS